MALIKVNIKKMFLYRKKNVDVFFACHYPVVLDVVRKLKKLEKYLYFFNFQYFITTEGVIGLIEGEAIDYKNDFNIIKASDELFDFSRYNDFLKISEKTSITLMINDTLGKGRKFNWGLGIYLYLSFLLVHIRLFHIAAPLDRDNHRAWICPYFIMGRTSELQALNWFDWELAESKLLVDELENIETWLNKNWRSRHVSSIKKREVKKKTLILERALMCSLKPNKWIFAFSKRNLFRALNRFV